MRLIYSLSEDIFNWAAKLRIKTLSLQSRLNSLFFLFFLLRFYIVIIIQFDMKIYSSYIVDVKKTHEKYWHEH